MNPHDHVDVLLVDENRADADLLTRAFANGGFKESILWAQDGVAALDFIRGAGDYRARDTHQLPKLILLDLKMPRLDGLDFLRDLKGDEHTRSIPVVILTSSNLPRDVADSYRIGANGYVAKPIGFAELTATISQIANYWLRINQVPK